MGFLDSLFGGDDDAKYPNILESEKITKSRESSGPTISYTENTSNQPPSEPPSALGGVTATAENQQQPFVNPWAVAQTDNQHDPNKNNTDAHTLGMDLGQSAEAQPSEEGGHSGLGGSEDRPTYKGKENMKGEIMVKVIDSLSDLMTKYILNGNNGQNRRHLNATGWNMGNVIPQVMGNAHKTAWDRIGLAKSFMKDPQAAFGNMAKGYAGKMLDDATGISVSRAAQIGSFATSFAGNPQAAIAGAAMSLIKEKMDDMPGSSPFEEETQLARGDKGSKMRDIQLFKGIHNYVTKGVEGDSLLEKAKLYVAAEANHATQKGGRNRMVLNEALSEETTFIKNKTIMPYLIIACVLYKAFHHRNLDINEAHGMYKDYILSRALKVVLKDVLGLENDVAGFAVEILEALPQELISAFIRNIDTKQPIYDDEKIRIDKFRDFIRERFRATFDGGYYDAVRKFQGQNIDLVGLMNGLSTSRVLHLFATQIETGDNVVWEAFNNQGLFMGLLELTAIHARGDAETSNGNAEDFLEQAYVMGVVRFMPLRNIPQHKHNANLEAMKQMENADTKEFAKIYRDGDKIVVALRGTNFKREKGDLVPKDYEANLENVAGSTDLYKTDDYTQANNKIEEAIALSKKTGGKVSVVGHSLGGRIGLSLASHYQSIPFHIYEPVIPINREMDKVFSNLKHSNVNIYRVHGSAISQNLEEYRKRHKFKLKTFKRKRHSSHSINNFR